MPAQPIANLQHLLIIFCITGKFRKKKIKKKKAIVPKNAEAVAFAATMANTRTWCGTSIHSRTKPENPSEANTISTVRILECMPGNASFAGSSMSGRPRTLFQPDETPTALSGMAWLKPE